MTSSGSIGLLIPPSLPIILYGVTAQINIKHMFAGGILPGVLMVLCLCAFGVVVALRRKVERVRLPAWREAWGAVRESFWEILLPVVILVMYFLGLTTLVETGAVAVLYSLIVEVADPPRPGLRGAAPGDPEVRADHRRGAGHPGRGQGPVLLHRGRRGAGGPERLGQGQRELEVRVPAGPEPGAA